MGEPVTLYAPDGSTLIVYGMAQLAVWVEQGFSLTPPETEPVKEPEPPPAPKPPAKGTGKRPKL